MLRVLSVFLALFAILIADEVASLEGAQAQSIKSLVPEDKFASLPKSESKIVYLKNKDMPDGSYYVGQKIELNYDLYLLGGAKFYSLNLLSHPGLALLSAAPWEDQNIDEQTQYYRATLTFKIVSTRASLPKIQATALTSDLKKKDSSTTKSQALSVFALSGNSRYSGVIGESLEVVQSVTKSYDDVSNIMILELKSRGANLEDFRIPGDFITSQGFQNIRYSNPEPIEQYNAPLSEEDFDKSAEGELDSKNEGQSAVPAQSIEQLKPEYPSYGDELKDGVYYVIFPKRISNLTFDYFANNSYHSVNIPVVLRDDSVSTQDDLKPKNIFLLSSSLFLVFLVVFFGIVYIVRRKRFFLIMALILLMVLLWQVFYRHNVKLSPSSDVKILPTERSTVLYVVPEVQRAKVLDSHGDFYKVQLQNGLIGWILKKDVK